MSGFYLLIMIYGAYLLLTVGFTSAIDFLLLKLGTASDVRKLVRISLIVVWLFFGIIIAFIGLIAARSDGYLG